jgi:WD40 repeat protein
MSVYEKSADESTKTTFKKIAGNDIYHIISEGYYSFLHVQAHDGPVLSLVYSPSYVVSSGSDGKLCIWERFQGHLINTINMVGVKSLSIVQGFIFWSKNDSQTQNLHFPRPIFCGSQFIHFS